MNFLKRLFFKKDEVKIQKKTIPDPLVIKVETILALGVEKGILEPKELGQYMYDFVCPFCSAMGECPVSEAYNLMAEGADKKTVAQKMEVIGEQLGIKKYTTPDFLKPRR